MVSATASDQAVRKGAFNYMADTSTPSLFRNGKVLTRRDRDGSDSGWEGVDREPRAMPVQDARILRNAPTLASNGYELRPRDLRLPALCRNRAGRVRRQPGRRIRSQHPFRHRQRRKTAYSRWAASSGARTYGAWRLYADECATAVARSHPTAEAKRYVALCSASRRSPVGSGLHQ